MSLISDLIPVVDSARNMIDQIGFRIHPVSTVLYTWGPNGKGVGAPASVVNTPLVPKPKVLKYTTEEIIQSGGSITEADYKVSKISKVYSLVQLIGPDNLPRDQEFFWSIDGVLCTVVGHEEKPLGWNIQVRRTNRYA